MILDSVEIQKILPHRYPFLMVDGILEVLVCAVCGVGAYTGQERLQRQGCEDQPLEVKGRPAARHDPGLDGD